MGKPVTPEFLKKFLFQLSTLFDGALRDSSTMWDMVAMRIPSNTKSMSHAWLQSLPNMREWIGARYVHRLETVGFEIVNKKYEITTAIPIDDLEDDQTGLYGKQMELIGQSADQKPEELISGLLENGFTGTAYDGQNFFDTDHPLKDGSVQSNTLDDVLTHDSFSAARTLLLKMKNYIGNPFGNGRELVLIVPPALETVARKILEGERDANGETNVLRGTAKVVVWTWLTSDTKWYVQDVGNRGLRPLIWQDRLASQFTVKGNPEDDNVFWDDEIVVGAKMRGAPGYGLYQLIVGSTGTV